MHPVAPIAIAAVANETFGNPQNPPARRHTVSDEALFFHAWLRQRAIIGAIMPTRRPLAHAMAQAVASDGPVLELGGGTGPITRALVEFGVSPARLTVIERSPVFHRLLTDRFPSLRILCGDAENLCDLLAPGQWGQVGTVVSSLPRVGWPLARQHAILEQCFAALRDDGVFLEFSYGPLPPVPRRLAKELGLTARRLRWLGRNFPPATIWEYRRGQRPEHPSNPIGSNRIGAGRCLHRINSPAMHRSGIAANKTVSMIGEDDA